MTAQEQLRGAMPCPRSGVAAERSYPVSEVRGGSCECQAATAKERPKGATPCPRSGAVAQRSYPTSEVRSSSCAFLSSHEETPHVQGKRNPSKMVGTEKGDQRADRLKPQPQTTGKSDHTDHRLV